MMTIHGSRDALRSLSELADNATGDAVVFAGTHTYRYEISGRELQRTIIASLADEVDILVDLVEIALDQFNLVVSIDDREFYSLMIPQVADDEIAKIKALLSADPWGPAPQASSF